MLRALDGGEGREGPDPVTAEDTSSSFAATNVLIPLLVNVPVSRPAMTVSSSVPVSAPRWER
jgi:hypothetical protein